MNTENTFPTTLLIPGHWLGAWAWDDVVAHWGDGRSSVVALTLPGLDPADPRRVSRTLDDQVAAILRVAEEHSVSPENPCVIVAHSGANAPVCVFLDAHPEWVRRVIWVESGPVAPGTVFAPDLPAEVEELPLPDWNSLGAQASLDGLDERSLERFRAGAVPQPAAVLRAAVELPHDAGRRVPATFVCCSFASEQVRQAASAGHPMFAEVARLEDVEMVDVPTGHWPMWSRPLELARVLRDASRR